MTIKQVVIRTAVEMALLLALAVIVGAAWNYRLLANAWSGRATAAAPVSTGAQAAIPLPLGVVQVKELFDKKEAVFVDARDRNAYGTGHIRGAMSLPLMEAATLVPELSDRVPKDATLVVYCNGYACEDSVELGKQLLSAGYRTVYYFDGGFPAWLDAKYPVAKGVQTGHR